MNAGGTLGSRGRLFARKIGAQKAPISWRLRNALRWGYIKGVIAAHIVAPFANLWGVCTFMGSLSIRVHRADGTWVNYGTVGYRVITSAGVGYLVDAWQNSTEVENLKYHGCGTGTTAEASGDTALVTESTTALNPDSTRATGTQTEAAANIIQSVGTVTFDASAAITEHGLFSQAATGGGSLWDRTVFSAINVASGDSIQFTYQGTLSAGG